MRTDRGLSLLEALFGMLVSFMVLAAVCVVLQQSVSVGGTLDEQGTVSEVNHAFYLIRRDISGASLVAQPTGIGEAQILVSMVDPALPFVTRIANHDAFEASERVAVTYFRADEVLQREVARGASVVDQMRVLRCSGFDASRTGTLVTVRVSIKLKRVVKAFQMQCRIRPG